MSTTHQMGITRRRSLIAIAGLLVAFILGAAVTWFILTRPFVFGGGGDALVDRPMGPMESFEINGAFVEPVQPGGSEPLSLSISNPMDSDLAVSRILVEVHAVDAPNATAALPCTVDDFAVDQLPDADEYIVGAGATRTLADLGILSEDWPRVRMLNTESNQDGCKGATFSLSYSAVGRIVA